MKAELILVGKTTDKLFATGIADYADRITHYLSFSINTIPALKNTKNLSEEEQKKAEGELILRQLQPSDTVVLLDESGAHQHGDGCMAAEEDADRTPTGLRHRRSLRLL